MTFFRVSSRAFFLGGILACSLACHQADFDANAEGTDHGHHAHHEADSQPAGESNSDKAPSDSKLMGIYQAYFQIHHALAHDDANGASEAYANLLKSFETTESHADLRRLRSVALAGTNGEQSLEVLRGNFKDLSEVFIAVAEHAGVPGEKVYVQYCPMAFGNQGAQWLQDKAAVENPYYGSGMFACGSTKKILSSSGNSVASQPAAQERTAP